MKVPVIDHWWQTETSWAISSNCTGIEMMKTKYGSACKAVPGYDVKVIKSDQSIAKTNEMGDIVVKLPLPPGTFPTLWNADKRYIYLLSAFHNVGNVPGGNGSLTTISPISLVFAID